MIPVFRPSMGQDECDAVAEVLKSGWIGLGPKTKHFEEKFSDYIGVEYAVAVNSATAALHLALAVLNLDGGEVITTPMTFISTSHAILYNNAIPVFCDIEVDTLNIDASKIERLINEKTRAILVVHYGGYAADMETIKRIAKRNSLFIIEDAAHACGGEYEDLKLGSIGKLGAFSFHAVKNLSTGDGGMITTNDENFYKRLLKLRWMGITKDTWNRAGETSKGYSWYYNVEALGFKCHMNDISAALGLVQLSKLDKMNHRRQEISKYYTEEFRAYDAVLETPVLKPYMTRPAFHNYVIKYEDRDGLHEFLKKSGISTGVHYIPNNHYDMYKQYRGDTPVSDKIWKRLLTLPLYPDMTNEQVEFICGKVRSYLEQT